MRKQARRALHAAALLVAVLAVGAGTRAGADDLPTADELRATIAAATGPALPASFERITFTRGGTAGSETIARSGDDARTTETFGPLRRAWGRFGGQAWHQNENGQTVLDQPDPGDTRSETYTATVSRVSVPFAADVLANLNSAGSGSKLYVDPATGHVVRREAITPTGTRTTDYDDFRTVAGYTTAWHWTVRDGRAEDAVDYRVDDLQARAVTADEIGIAPPRRALVEFPVDADSVQLPVRLVHNSFVVRVMVGSRGLDFLLDSGAAGIAVDDGVVRELGLTTVARFSNAANAGRYTSALAVVPEMHVGALRMRDGREHDTGRGRSGRRRQSRRSAGLRLHRGTLAAPRLRA